MGTAGIPRNLLVSRGHGYECYGNTAGMALTMAGFPRGWIIGYYCGGNSAGMVGVMIRTNGLTRNG